MTAEGKEAFAAVRAAKATLDAAMFDAVSTVVRAALEPEGADVAAAYVRRDGLGVAVVSLPSPGASKATKHERALKGAVHGAPASVAVHVLHAEPSGAYDPHALPPSEWVRVLEPPRDAQAGGLRCDHCRLPAGFTCGCQRCGREPDDDERYHACAEHKGVVSANHARVRDRFAQWVPVLRT